MTASDFALSIGVQKVMTPPPDFLGVGSGQNGNDVIEPDLKTTGVRNHCDAGQEHPCGFTGIDRLPG